MEKKKERGKEGDRVLFPLYTERRKKKKTPFLTTILPNHSGGRGQSEKGRRE